MIVILHMRGMKLLTSLTRDLNPSISLIKYAFVPLLCTHVYLCNMLPLILCQTLAKFNMQISVCLCTGVLQIQCAKRKDFDKSVILFSNTGSYRKQFRSGNYLIDSPISYNFYSNIKPLIYGGMNHMF